MLCDSATSCSQCLGGYYLDASAAPNTICQPCRHEGCEICAMTNPLECISCNSRYYLNSTSKTCIQCRTEPLLAGCLSCESSLVCLDCDPGYFINSANQCELCATNIEGCGRCASASACLECKSTYYLLANSSCGECKIPLPGCSYCINSSACESCYYGYYLNSSQ